MCCFQFAAQRTNNKDLSSESTTQVDNWLETEQWPTTGEKCLQTHFYFNNHTKPWSDGYVRCVDVSNSVNPGYTALCGSISIKLLSVLGNSSLESFKTLTMIIVFILLIFIWLNLMWGPNTTFEFRTPSS